MGKVALLVAGGTGGHLVPALALREALVARGWDVHVATDPRVGGFVSGVPADRVHLIRSATYEGASPRKLLATLSAMGQGLRESRRLLARLKPAIVVGFGGYPTVPPLVVSRTSSVPMIVHEQNAVLGRANRLLVRLGAVLATGFENPKGAAKARRIVHVGNPIRSAVLQAAATPYAPPSADGPFHLLVFGGSQGARVFSGLVPGALAQLSPERRARLRVVQQARAEDAEATRAAFAGVGIEATVSPFFEDMPARIAACHLALCRAGASSVSELAAIGRPAILVPYPHALDHDQAANAAVLAAKGGAWIVPERELTPEALARRLASLMDDPRALQGAAAAAAATGRTDAAERLADLVGDLART